VALARASQSFWIEKCKYLRGVVGCCSWKAKQKRLKRTESTGRRQSQSRANSLETEYFDSLPNKVRPLLVKCVVQECPRNRFGIEIRNSKWGSYGGADLRRDLHFVAAVEISNLSCYFFALSLGFGSCNAEKAQLNLF